MGSRKQVALKLHEDTVKKLERYRRRRGYESQSDAHRELLEVGMQERVGTRLWQVRDRVIDAAWHLGLVAAVLLIVGFLPGTLPTANSVLYAVVILSTAGGAVAVVELARVVRGENTIPDIRRGEQ